MAQDAVRTCVPVERMVMGMLANNVYIVSDGTSTIVVDPTCDAPAIVRALKGRALDAIFLTHCHGDHVGAAAALREATGATVVASAADAPFIDYGENPVRPADDAVASCAVDTRVEQGDIVEVGSMAFKVLHTPGHTPGSICFYIVPACGTDPQGSPVLISGDTLFEGSIGRTDFEGGSMADMRASLKTLAKLPDETIVLPGHGNPTLIGAERKRVFAYYA